MSFWDFLKPKKKKVKIKPFHMTLDIPAHAVHIVSDPLKYGDFLMSRKRVKGYFIRPWKGKPAEIWILGKKRKDGTVVPKQGYRIYGHEGWHFLDELDGSGVITNPDKILVKEEYD